MNNNNKESLALRVKESIENALFKVINVRGCFVRGEQQIFAKKVKNVYNDFVRYSNNE